MSPSANQGELFERPPIAIAAKVAEVAVAARVRRTLTYVVPDGVPVAEGHGVIVPLGTRTVEGFVLRVRPGEASDGELKSIVRVKTAEPVVSASMLSLAVWMAEYYGADVSECLQAVVPAPVRGGVRLPTARVVELAIRRDEAAALLLKLLESARNRAQTAVLNALLESSTPLPIADLKLKTSVGDSPIRTLARRNVLRITEVVVRDDGASEPKPVASQPRPRLTDDQAIAVDAILPAITARESRVFALIGVTGSGKTEVYLRACEEALSLGRSAIMLVPEIALTPQTVERFRARLGDVAVLHSNQSDSARVRQWAQLKSGVTRVALGPRSALFAPLTDLGVIIIDEEHETTFKQQNAPRYQTRDVAMRRAQADGSVLILGSATPSLETEWLGRSGTASRLELPRRVSGRPMPDIRIVDMRNEKPLGPGGLFSTPLYHQVREAISRKEQVLLFLNRRGFSTQVLCKRCGWAAKCGGCAVHLTYYFGASTLLCHYCGTKLPPPSKCPDCGSPQVRYQGSGTERVETAAKALFPGAHVARMDGETLQARGSAERIYDRLRDGTIDVLVGTQVIAKGFDIPNVTTVGVIHADTALLIPDFRAAERTFQLLCQVAGRAGRGDRAGRVFVQTYEPTHYAVTCAARHDWIRFSEQELEYRKAAGYPPFGQLLRVVCQGPDDLEVQGCIESVRRALDGELARTPGTFTILGPAPCPLHQLQGAFRWHVIVRTSDTARLTALLGAVPDSPNRRVRTIVDRDPVAMM